MPESKNVCMVIWNYWPGLEGGAERQCRKLSQALSGRGIPIMVVTQKAGWFDRKLIFDNGIPIFRLGFFAPLAAISLWIHKWNVRWSRAAGTDIHHAPSPRRRWGITTPIWFLARLSFMIAAKRHIARHQGQLRLIHVHESNWISGFASWLGHRTGLPVLCKAATLPCLSPMGPDVPFRSALSRWRLRNDFIALNRAMAAELESASVSPAKIHVIPNGVDIPPASASPGENHDVLFIANFSQGPHLKAFDILLTAWAEVHKQNRLPRLIMAGAGDNRPWRRLAAILGCGDSVSFMGFSDKLDDLYRGAALFVLPSRIEGMSNALLEAQSHGIPAVVSDIPGNLAVVSEGRNGLVVPVGRADALARAIVRLLDDPALRIRLGSRARQLARENFSMPSIAARMVDLYSRIAVPAKDNQGE